MNENTIIIWNPHYVTKSVSDKLIEALISQGYTVKHFVPEISGSFDGLQVWEYQKMRNSFELYIEKMISTNIEKGIFVPVLHQDIHDKGWGEYMHRRIFSTIKRQTQATIFPLFVDYLYPDNKFQDAGITVRSQSIDVDISKAVKRIAELCKKPI